MLSVALARAAAEAGHKVLFTTCEDLVRRLRRAIAEHRAASGLRFFTTPKLLVIDEVGYRILDEEARSLLFEVINARYLKGSIITTSHVGIASWAERLGDPMLAAAALDRLLHRGVIVGIDGPSYRMRAHQQRADTIRKATGTRTGARP
jgi:DNA replication protein DnaC